MTIARKSYGWERHVPNNNKTRQNYNHVLIGGTVHAWTQTIDNAVDTLRKVYQVSLAQCFPYIRPFINLNTFQML